SLHDALPIYWWKGCGQSASTPPRCTPTGRERCNGSSTPGSVTSAVSATGTTPRSETWCARAWTSPIPTNCAARRGTRTNITRPRSPAVRPRARCLSGAVVLGPVGAVAGAVIGYTAGLLSLNHGDYGDHQRPARGDALQEHPGM